jgi:hypothetical protein
MSLGFKLAASALLVPRTGHEVFAFNERLIVLGGFTTGAISALLIESAVVDEGGNLNQFKVTAALPPALNAGRSNFGLAQDPNARNRIYVVGGETAGATVAYADVAIGLVNTDGSVLWSVGPKLPAALAGVKVAIVNGWLYAVGGDTLDSTVLPTNVLASKIQSDGSLGPWINATPLIAPGGSQGGKITGHLVMGSKKYLYVAGGLPKGGTASQFIYRAIPQQGSGQFMAWDTEQLGMTQVRVNAGAPVLLLGPLAILGGSTTGLATNALATVEEARLSGDGRINQQLREDQLPQALMGAKVAALNRQFFAIGGENSSGSILNLVYEAQLQDDLQV